jgi:SpoIIAA-like
VIKLLLDLPDQVVGIDASGQVIASDYETVLMPAIKAALKTHDRVRVLYRPGPEFTGFTPGAMWDDMKLGILHLKAWEKIAVVTDVKWIASAMSMFGFAMPRPGMVFCNNESAEARKWISAWRRLGSQPDRQFTRTPCVPVRGNRGNDTREGEPR